MCSLMANKLTAKPRQMFLWRQIYLHQRIERCALWCQITLQQSLDKRALWRQTNLQQRLDRFAIWWQINLQQSLDRCALWLPGGSPDPGQCPAVTPGVGHTCSSSQCRRLGRAGCWWSLRISLCCTSEHCPSD